MLFKEESSLSSHLQAMISLPEYRKKKKKDTRQAPYCLCFNERHVGLGPFVHKPRKGVEWHGE